MAADDDDGGCLHADSIQKHAELALVIRRIHELKAVQIASIHLRTNTSSTTDSTTWARTVKRRSRLSMNERCTS